MTNTNTPSKLLNQVRDRIRVKHYSIRTKTQYVQWIKRFILFHNKRHPKEMGGAEVEAFFVCAVLPPKRDGVCNPYAPT